MKRFILILILMLMVSIFLAACAPAQRNPAPGASAAALTRTDSQGAVIVKVTPLNLDNPGDTLQFNVVMDTHSVELDMDLAAIATLTTDTGLTLQPALSDIPQGGHHAEGTLFFPTRQDEMSILNGVKQLTLTISDLDSVMRTFTWDLNAQ